MQFKKAERKRSKLRIALAGTSGSGKTYSALLIAKGMGGRIGVIDTERDSASLYEDLVDFDVLTLESPFSPERYIEAIKMAEKEGFDTLIIDSASHEWTGGGGCLEIVDVLGRTKFRGNSYMAWGDVTPRHNAFIDAIIRSSVHIILTMRSKQDYVITENSKGKSAPKKVGLAPVQRDGFEYEFTVMLDISNDGHYATTSKNRTSLFNDDGFIISEQTGVDLINWLNSGVDVAVRDKGIMQGLVEDIIESKDIDSLKSQYGEAIQWGNSSSLSPEDRMCIVEAKDDAKKRLIKQEAELDEKS